FIKHQSAFAPGYGGTCGHQSTRMHKTTTYLCRLRLIRGWSTPLTAKSASGTVAEIYAEVRKTQFPHRDLHTVLNSQVLVLNRLWQAVNICTARRAFALVYAGHAQIVSSDEPNNFMT